MRKLISKSEFLLRSQHETSGGKLRFCNKGFAAVRKSGGFTLIELMLAIVIFVSFLVLVSNSFIAIIRAQVSANETRQMYSELRNFVDFVNGEMREGTVDYLCYDQKFSNTLDDNSPLLVRCVDVGELTIGEGNNLRTISKDGQLSSVIKFVPGSAIASACGDAAGGVGCVMVQKFRNLDGVWAPESGYEGGFKQFAFGNLNIKNLHFDIYPKADPVSDSSDLSTQLQPMVEMSLDVASTNPSVNFNLQFQTMITSRAK